MRAETAPSGLAVASVIASGCRTDAARASSNHAWNWANGSDATVSRVSGCVILEGMAFHHVALACRDLEATHRFYSEAMGFQLVKVDAIPFMERGWARHLFYDTGNGELLAIWDLHDEELPEFNPALSVGLGLPNFVNHIAFGAADLDDLEARKDRWLAQGHDVAKIDHGWCTSIYTDDPGGTMVEFCTLTRTLTDDDRRQAQDYVTAAKPPIDTTPPRIELFEAAKSRENAGVS